MKIIKDGFDAAWDEWKEVEKLFEKSLTSNLCKDEQDLVDFYIDNLVCIQDIKKLLSKEYELPE